MTNAGLAFIVKRIGERANVENVHLHRFRRWFATYMINRGVPIQDLKEMLGHSDISSTQIYAQIARNKLKDVYQKTHPRA